jgi:acyl carrier protein
MQAHDEYLQRLVDEVGRLITSTLLVEVGTPEDDLLATGVLDSMTLFNLLATLEERFGIRIVLDELEIDDVRSILSIAHLIEALSQRPANETAHGAKRDARPSMKGDHAVDAAF